ncbi:GntR family transcriptional regulator [Planosporangium mesophilum]|uniref:Putative transcriptional regulator, GntR family protein n=1 Tax=Planosporangium mesophilum TaxID=689768 RepID=A0A8J3TER1_9ACTN|nr:GntR family transcriptional regulator [Planosporangium mesophilum]NJC82506.1 GntR family transcriptional regulator [Planosporangium mesophilum]GII25493.1 putative transcriptional regulator, GntR family protein [Planosporangium mesophilum]
MPIKPPPVKYLRIVNAIQSRIEDGTYPVGTKVPSEADLVREFGVSRATVVRSLELLRQQGWLEGQQGVGRIVLDRPSTPGRRVPKALRAMFAAEDPATVTLLSVVTVPAPIRAAATLDVPTGTPVVIRRRLVAAAQLGPVELSTVYTRAEVAGALAGRRLVADDLLHHVAQRTATAADHIAVHITARRPHPAEATLLKVDRRDCLTTVLLRALSRGRPVLAVDAVIATNRRPLDAVFPAM